MTKTNAEKGVDTRTWAAQRARHALCSPGEFISNLVNNFPEGFAWTDQGQPVDGVFKLLAMHVSGRVGIVIGLTFCDGVSMLTMIASVHRPGPDNHIANGRVMAHFANHAQLRDVEAVGNEAIASLFQYWHDRPRHEVPSMTAIINWVLDLVELRGVNDLHELSEAIDNLLAGRKPLPEPKPSP